MPKESASVQFCSQSGRLNDNCYLGSCLAARTIASGAAADLRMFCQRAGKSDVGIELCGETCSSFSVADTSDSGGRHDVRTAGKFDTNGWFNWY